MGENMEVLQLEAQAHVWNHTFKIFSSMALKCAVQLGIPDIIHSHGQPMSLSDLATILDVQPTKLQCLGRLMRLLVHSGFFAQTHEEDNVKYTLTPPSRLLLRRSAAELDTTAILFLNLDKATIASWEGLSDWLCSSNNNEYSNTFEMANNGMSIWDRVAEEPGVNDLFHQLMVCDSQLIGRVVTREYSQVFEGLKSLVDVGGGTGAMASTILQTFPHISCVVFDLPHVVANLQPTSKNMSFVGGDMFRDKIPPANAVLLKWVLHNWNDQESISILKKCKDAIPSRADGGKLIIIEMVMEDKLEDEKSTETKLYLDLLMMIKFNGKQRNEREWKNLFTEAGFTDYKIISNNLGLRSLIEVYP